MPSCPATKDDRPPVPAADTVRVCALDQGLNGTGASEDSSGPKREPWDTSGAQPHPVCPGQGFCLPLLEPWVFSLSNKVELGTHRVALVSLIPLGNSNKTLLMTESDRSHQGDRHPCSTEKYHSSIVATKRPTSLPDPREPSYRVLIGRQERPGDLVGV